MHVECCEHLILLLELVQQMVQHLEQLEELLRLVLCCTLLVQMSLELSCMTYHRRIRSLKLEQVLIRKRYRNQNHIRNQRLRHHG